MNSGCPDTNADRAISYCIATNLANRTIGTATGTYAGFIRGDNDLIGKPVTIMIDQTGGNYNPGSSKIADAPNATEPAEVEPASTRSCYNDVT